MCTITCDYSLCSWRYKQSERFYARKEKHLVFFITFHFFLKVEFTLLYLCDCLLIATILAGRAV